MPIAEHSTEKWALYGLHKEVITWVPDGDGGSGDDYPVYGPVIKTLLAFFSSKEAAENYVQKSKVKNKTWYVFNARSVLRPYKKFAIELYTEVQVPFNPEI